jgi:hypothetical protein
MRDSGRKLEYESYKEPDMALPLGLHMNKNDVSLLM